jgi:alkanesulfonate monooxygenase SsuD/methylene tetrahydromethanopterin reductase-like flavin-dependent oxidoreductase (luciferase family)
VTNEDLSETAKDQGIEKIAPPAFELGLYSFAELTPDPTTGIKISPAQRLSNLLESIELRGANFVGGPEEIIEKILFQHEIFGYQRLLLQLTVGTMPHTQVMHAIELLGTKVAPVVRAEVAKRVRVGP